MNQRTPRRTRDRGDTMLMSVILIGFLMIGSFALISAGESWNARREAHQTASAAARAGAQVTPQEANTGEIIIDPGLAARRAQTIIDASGHTGTVRVNGTTVTATVTVSVDYSFPAPGFSTSLTSSATASSDLGINDG